MVTVKQFLDSGFEFVVDDELALSGNQKATYNLMPADLSAIEEEQERYNDDFVINLSWRKNTGVQPVGDDCWVEVEQHNGAKQTTEAADVYWVDKNRPADIKQWKPSLKHLEKQMNADDYKKIKKSIKTFESKFSMTDNQETKTALEMSERDIESYADESEWANGDECYYYNEQRSEGGYLIYVSQHPTHNDHSVVYAKNEPVNFFSVPTSMLSKPETPEQKAARERMEAAYDLYVACGIHHETISFDKFKKNQSKVWLAIVDKTGYRKQ